MKSRSPSWKLFFKLSLAVVVILAAAGPSLSAETTQASGDSNLKVIVFIGDSLTQGYGVRAEEAYPELVGKKLVEAGYNVKIINGGISGSVTAEADRRLRWYLKAKPSIVVFALGANDGMKGAPPEVIEKNLAKAVDLAKESGIEVLLAGLKMFSNLGPEYVRKFESIYPRLAKQKRVALIPFLLEDVALQKEYNQSDMRHPNAEGHVVIANRVTRELEAVLKKIGVKRNVGEKP